MKGGLIIQFGCLSNTATLVLFSASRSNFVLRQCASTFLLLISQAPSIGTRPNAGHHPLGTSSPTPSLSFLTCSAGGRRTLHSWSGHRRSVRGHSSSFRPVQITASPLHKLALCLCSFFRAPILSSHFARLRVSVLYHTHFSSLGLSCTDHVFTALSIVRLFFHNYASCTDCRADLHTSNSRGLSPASSVTSRIYLPSALTS